ncbi:MAG: hypothetical protein JWQ70_2887 [Aeromicrobium sp.]|nr:hypothetical protein [Aeromicrobium sp.]
MLVALLVVGACGSDPQPKEPKSTATASATPTISVPTMPAQAKENSPEGADAFLRHYVDVLNFASRTGNVSELSRLSSPKCVGCQRYIALYRDTYKSGGYFKDSDWTFSGSKLEVGDYETYLDVHVTAPKGHYKVAAGEPEKTGNGEDSDLSFAVARRGDEWRVTQLGQGQAR